MVFSNQKGKNVVKINGFGAGLSIVILLVLVYMAYNFGKNGKLIGG
jgi:hypothetical protein